MATEAQYAFFRFLYEEENAREDTINQYSKTLLSLTTLYSGFVIFVVEKMTMMTLPMKIMFVATVASMLTGLVVTVWGSRLADFEGVNDPEKVVDQYDDAEDMPDEQFFDKRIADFAIATNRNSRVNDRRAKALLIASYCLVAGILCHAIFFMIALF
ncbi:MAG: hypothetical protein EOR16_15610 [Mesorhizobium sp.]|uniref:hypothetical protein n=1 Tax=Mesorhizobium sp. TaxID=1871066 RepID=UPI000FE7985C|nr:hypothetical protein [Mesorhizobium sp.]RWI57032.1 MAG: hypothetical protein EOR16_15610 [Mesorhizobium sp.]